MMPMHFFFSDKVILLFDSWNVQSPPGMVLSVLVVLLLTFLYESIKVGKSRLFQKTKLAIPPNIAEEHLLEDSESVNNVTFHYSNPSQRWLWLHAGQSLVHIVQVVLGYLVMLCVMSYNSWIFLGVLMGSAIGYYLTYPLLPKIPLPATV